MSHPKRIDLLIAASLILATLAVFSQVRTFDFVNYDDDLFVSANQHIRNGWDSVAWAFTTNYSANWFPLTWLSYIAGYKLYGIDPGWHHLTNVFIHALTTAIFYFAFLRLTGARWPSAFVAFVFAMHPLHVEPVAWISERKEVLSGFFWALTLLAYSRYVKHPHWLNYFLVAAAFCGGLMSKAMIVTLPFVLLLLDYWPLRRRAILEKIPLFALVAIASLITWRVQKAGGAVASFAQLPFSLRIENALISYASYARQFFWPVNLAAIYPFDPNPWSAIGSAAALLAITAIAIVQRKRRPYLLAGWLWFLGTLVPVIGLVQIGIQARADRYTYIPILGLAIAIAWLGAEFPRPAIAAGAIAGCAWIAVSWTQLGYWHDSVALFRHTVEVTGGNWMALSTLSDALLKQNRLAEAEPYLREALRLRPNVAMVYVNLGSALSRRGDFRNAEEQYRRALQLTAEDPDAWEGLGIVLLEQGRMDEAEQSLLEAIRRRPDHANSHYNLGRLYALTQKPDRAIAQFTETIRLDPENAEAHYNLATALASTDRMQEAADQFRAAIALKADYVAAHFNLGSALANTGRYDQAIAEFKEVLRLQPDSVDARAAIAQCEQLRSGQ